PLCVREQRCGCEECHTCGEKLLDVPPGGGPARAGGTPPREKPAAAAAVVPAGGESAAVRVLPTVLAVAGAAVLAITFIDMARAAGGLLGQGAGFSSGSLRRTGYLLGGVLYSGSVRLLTGYALLALGMMLRPPRPFGTRSASQRGLQVTGALMGVTAAGCMVAAALLIIPGGGPAALSVKSSLPSLPYAVPVLVVLGLSLMWASYLTGARAAYGAAAGPPPGQGADGGDPDGKRANPEGYGGGADN
ncbi:MAG: hypothetical protein FJ313_07550, partial [Gemmatimonadetes bacterium]|nr:hypothetical protein [Gemmatimonadota bacterium]